MKKLVFCFLILNSTLCFSKMTVPDSYLLTITGVASSNIEENNNKVEKNIIYSGGFLIEDRMEEILGLESGILLINRQYDFEKNGFRIVQDVKRLHVPITARFWPTSFLSIAFGPFIEISSGEAKTLLKEGKNSDSDTTGAQDSLEFGVDTAVSLNVDIDRSTGFFLETRYSQIAGLQDEEKINSLSALAGIQMTI